MMSNTYETLLASAGTRSGDPTMGRFPVVARKVHGKSKEASFPFTNQRHLKYIKDMVRLTHTMRVELVTIDGSSQGTAQDARAINRIRGDYPKMNMPLTVRVGEAVAADTEQGLVVVSAPVLTATTLDFEADKLATDLGFVAQRHQASRLLIAELKDPLDTERLLDQVNTNLVTANDIVLTSVELIRPVIA